MQLRAALLSIFQVALCGTGFIWGMTAAFSPTRLRDFEMRITGAARFGIPVKQYRRSLGVTIAGVVAMLISLLGIGDGLYTIVAQPWLSRWLFTPHRITVLQLVVGIFLVVFGVIVLIIPQFILKMFRVPNVRQDPAKICRATTIPARVTAIVPLAFGLWMIVAWLRS
jgi:hypothetical protein